jgi:hypothetical protein
VTLENCRPWRSANSLAVARSRGQDYLLRIGYSVVARQFADARTIDGGRRWQHMQVDRMQVDRAPEIVRVRPGRLFSLLSLSLGFTHGIAPQV